MCHKSFHCKSFPKSCEFTSNSNFWSCFWLMNLIHLVFCSLVKSYIINPQSTVPSTFILTLDDPRKQWESGLMLCCDRTVALNDDGICILFLMLNIKVWPSMEYKSAYWKISGAGAQYSELMANRPWHFLSPWSRRVLARMAMFVYSEALRTGFGLMHVCSTGFRYQPSTEHNMLHKTWWAFQLLGLQMTILMWNLCLHCSETCDSRPLFYNSMQRKAVPI